LSMLFGNFRIVVTRTRYLKRLGKALKPAATTMMRD
jgi:hypothetical protein